MLSRTNVKFEWGKFSDKSKDYLRNSDAWINIANGAVRSGKTITCSARWLNYIGESPHTEFLMSGKTRTSLERNVLRRFREMLNTEMVDYTQSNYESTLTLHGEHEDKTIWLAGFNDEGATDVIAGMTVGGWYADEIARNPQSTVEMAISRCSLPGAKMFWNTNPDSPYHYIYTNYINNKQLLDDGTVKVWNFLLEDNPNLSDMYIEQLKKVNRKSPVFYKRNILGQWVVAEGAIYDMFIESENTFTETPNLHEINICCDYGVSTVTVFGVMGIERTSEGNNYYLLEEDYYDAEEQQVTQTDTERCDVIVRLQNKYKLNSRNTIFLPHDAASLKAEAQKDKRIICNVKTYTPDTYNDIGAIQDLIASRRFKIHTDCKHSILQAQTYSWDSKAQQRGEDRPLKINDHCPDMWRGGIFGHRNVGKRIYHAPRRVQI